MENPIDAGSLRLVISHPPVLPKREGELDNNSIHERRAALEQPVFLKSVTCKLSQGCYCTGHESTFVCSIAICLFDKRYMGHNVNGLLLYRFHDLDHKSIYDSGINSHHWGEGNDTRCILNSRILFNRSEGMYKFS